MRAIIAAVFVFLAAGGCSFAAGENPVGAAGAGQDASSTTPPDAGEPSISQKGAEQIDLPINASGDTKEKILAALKLIGEIKGEKATSGYDEKWQDHKLSGPDVMKKLKEQGLKEVGTEPCGPGETACVNPSNPGTIRLTPEWDSLTPTMRAMVIIHEGNHTGNGQPNYMHAMCPQGHQYAGRPACDTDAHGSYGSSTTTFGNVAKYCETCTSQVTGDAGEIRDSQMQRLLGEAKEKVSSDVGQ